MVFQMIEDNLKVEENSILSKLLNPVKKLRWILQVILNSFKQYNYIFVNKYNLIPE